MAAFGRTATHGPTICEVLLFACKQPLTISALYFPPVTPKATFAYSSSTTLSNYGYRFLRAKITFLVGLIAVAGCVTNREVEEREIYWKAEADRFFESPRDMADLHSWLREKQVYYTFEDSETEDGEWVKGVEKIYVDSLVCESWTIQLTVTVNDEDEILAHQVDKAGTCL